MVACNLQVLTHIDWTKYVIVGSMISIDDTCTGLLFDSMRPTSSDPIWLGRSNHFGVQQFNRLRLLPSAMCLYLMHKYCHMKRAEIEVHDNRSQLPRWLAFAYSSLCSCGLSIYKVTQAGCSPPVCDSDGLDSNVGYVTGVRASWVTTPWSELHFEQVFDKKFESIVQACEVGRC